MNNPNLRNRIEKAQGEIRLSYITPVIPQYGRLVYDYTDKSWIRFPRLDIVIKRSITNTEPRND